MPKPKPLTPESVAKELEKAIADITREGGLPVASYKRQWALLKAAGKAAEFLRGMETANKHE